MVTTVPPMTMPCSLATTQADQEDHDAGADDEDGPADVLDADPGQLAGEQDRANDHEDEADRDRRRAALGRPIG